MMLVLASAALASVTVSGDKSAWAEVGKAYQALNALSGYRMKATMPGGGEMVMDSAPSQKAMHTTMRMAEGAAVETIVVGSEVRYRMNLPGMPSGWRCQAQGPVQRPVDPTQATGTVNIARGPDTTIDGTAVHTYIYSASTGSGAGSPSAKTTLYVGVQSGLPRRMVVGNAQTFDYYDYGTKIQISLPACS